MVTHGEAQFECYHGHTWAVPTTTVDNNYYEAPETTLDVGDDEVQTCPVCGEDELAYVTVDKFADKITNDLYEILTGDKNLAEKCAELEGDDIARFKVGLEGILAMDSRKCYEALSAMHDVFIAFSLIVGKCDISIERLVA